MNGSGAKNNLSKYSALGSDLENYRLKLKSKKRSLESHFEAVKSVWHDSRYLEHEKSFVEYMQTIDSFLVQLSKAVENINIKKVYLAKYVQRR